MSDFVNIAGYQFVPLDNLAERKAKLLPFCNSLELKGTILLSLEGINLFLAGSPTSIEQFLAQLRTQPEFAEFKVKESISDQQPFNRMLVRLKKEIISMGLEEIRPRQKTSPKISPRELKAWLDDGRDIALLDVRNDYEIKLGTFANAIPIGIDHFRNFPAATERLANEFRDKPVVMFCTGGIRCEKAGPLMEQQGFAQVFQLDGGILNYFEECGDAHYRGDCFVFDKRVAVDPSLQETAAEQCYACQAILSLEDQQSELYVPPTGCPYCARPRSQPLLERLTERTARLRAATTPLPGCVPYDNVRSMNVPAKFDQRPLIEFLLSLHVELDREFWLAACKAGRIRYQDRPLGDDVVVRAGWRIQNITPQTVEPPVSNEIGFLFEDEGLIAISKPAPLPMHPCGRFNRNTLQNFLRLSYPHEQIRILHRLDAHTTGVLLLARQRDVAAAIHRQFANGEIKKTYLARVIGHPATDSFQCAAGIGKFPTAAQGLRDVDPNGWNALTRFEVVRRDPDGCALVRCFPVTGRTNQIRIHLAHLGFPILGDLAYGPTQDKPDPLEIAVTDRDPLRTRLCLHAQELDFHYPLNSAMQITAPDPVWAR